MTTTLADKAILSGVDNHPPMLEKDMYDSWKSIKELYMMNRQHGRIILESVKNGSLIWPTIDENGVTRPRKYSELSPAKAIQADCDVKATNIILQGLPPEVYALASNHKLRNSSKPRQQATINDGRVTLQPIQGRQVSFATGTSRTYTPVASGSNSVKQMTVICYNCKGEGHMSKQCTKPKRKQNDSWFKDKVLLVQAQENGQILHEDELAFLAYPGIAEGQATQTDRYRDLLRACPHHGFTELHQLDTFYNALNPADQDSLNAAARENLLERHTQDVLMIIENKSKVRNSRSKSVVSQVKACDVNSNSSSEIAKLTLAVNQQMSAVTTVI
nr:reverse transcriptase domain-containing protein [Tanacetum cinerariifolium]